MKKLIHLLVLIMMLAGFSCKKAIENKQRDIIIDAMTNGVWIVEQYMEGATDITASFAGYEFKFNTNETVTGTKGAMVESGTWSGNATNYTITSQFPAAGDPLKKLNGVWKLTDSEWVYVEAEMTTTSGKNILHLRKKP